MNTPATVPTDITELLTAELGAGVFGAKLAHIISEVAAAVVEHGRKGNVTIKLDFARNKDSAMVNIDHGVSYKRPTKNGEGGETDTTSTPMHVTRGGRLSLWPDDGMPGTKQATLFDQHGRPKADNGAQS